MSSGEERDLCFLPKISAKMNVKKNCQKFELDSPILLSAPMSVTPTAHPLFWHRHWIAILESSKVQSIRTNNSSYASQNMMWRERASVWWTVISQEIEGFCNQYLLSKWNVEANILAMKVMVLKRCKSAEVNNYFWLYLEITRLHPLSSANVIGEVKNILARWEIQS